MRSPRVTIRARLTTLFAALFGVLAAVLVTTAYLFVAGATAPEAQRAEREELLQAALAEQGVELPTPPADGPPMPSAGADAPENPIGATLDAIAAQSRANVLDTLLTRSLVAFGLAAVVAVALAWWLAGRVLRPVDEIARAASSLSETTLDQRLPLDGPDDEFARLRKAFNGMLGRLQTAFEARQRFAADASHELRTPLAVLRASADNVLAAPRAAKQAKELASEVSAQVERADSLMTSLLTLARADDVIHTREAVDLADLAADVVSEASPVATARGIALDLEIADAPVLGDRVLLGRMVANLVDNAIRYNRAEGGHVRCGVRVTGEQAVVEVENSGPTVAADAIPALFERFRRGDERSEEVGHGLGLPIVSRVAEVHGGSVEASPGDDGGLVVRVSLPLRG